MRKHTGKHSIIALALATALTVSGVPTLAFADTDLYASVETKAGLIEAVPLGATESTADSATTILTTAKNFVTENNMLVNYEGKATTYIEPKNDVLESEETHYTSTSQDGVYKAEGGSERTVLNHAPHVSINIPLTIDDKDTEADEGLSTAEGKATVESPVAKDPKSSAEDGIYDYTTAAIKSQGVVSVKTAGISILAAASNGANGAMTYINNTTEATGDNGLVAKKYAGEVVVPNTLDIQQGYEFEFVGSDKLSRYWAAQLIEDELQSAGDGPIYTSEDGKINLYSEFPKNALIERKFTVPRIYLNFDDPIEGPWPAQYDSVQQFVLADKSGNTVTTYCADLLTPAYKGHDYIVKSIEDADYYSKENAAMIRSIALNGYWGTDSGFGSLSAMKDMLRASGKFTEAEIALLNDGMALTATQYAIWTYSNSLNKRVFVNCYYAAGTSLGNGDKTAPATDVDLIFKLYRYLITLPPTTTHEMTTGNTAINSESFIEDATLLITGKPADELANKDANSSNDVYTVDLYLDLKVQPKEGNGDDLVITVMNGEEVVAIGRIAGELKEGEQRLAEENGRYVVSNLKLQEGETESVTIAMSGTQNLARGAYLFSSEYKIPDKDLGKSDATATYSQTMVGIAEGPRAVNASLLLSFNLAVDDEVLETEHVWRTEDEPLPDTGDSPKPPSKDDAVLAPTGDDATTLPLITLALASFAIAIAILAQQRRAK